MEWIPTAERLPDDETPVLLVRKGSVVVGERCWDHPGHEDTYQSYWYWSCVDEHWSDDHGEATVTHWMPLPALPFNAELSGAEGEFISEPDVYASSGSNMMQGFFERMHESSKDAQAERAKRIALEKANKELRKKLRFNAGDKPPQVGLD